MENNLNGQRTFSITAILRGTLVSFLSTLTFSLLTAAYVLVMRITVLPERCLFYLGILAAAIGGCLAARRTKAKGWLHGACVGLLFLTMSYLLFGLEGGSGRILWTKALITIVAACIGGMFGMLGSR